ncbi:MAG: transglutaminase [Flavobacteriaceae bacterium]|nr:MAG: transglutaminase [Flavobacteriaceae bacterium]
MKFVCPTCKEELEFDDRSENEKKTTVIKNTKEETSLADTVINYMSWFVAFPIFIIAHKLLPNPDWIFNLDRFLIGIIIIMGLRLILKKFRVGVIGALIISLIWLSYGSLAGEYGFISVYRDYKEMVLTMIKNPHPERIVLETLKPFPNKSVIKKAIDFENPLVRNFAVASSKNFKEVVGDYKEHRTIIQCFSVFKKINSNWEYVSDPVSREYFAKASESMEHLSGDCDDYSILMAACIKSIGGTSRLIHTNGHLYPELLIGSKKDLKKIIRLVKQKLFSDESYNKRLIYHIDDYDQVWLNLDYTEKYPGGPFMSETILGVLMLD